MSGQLIILVCTRVVVGQSTSQSWIPNLNLRLATSYYHDGCVAIINGIKLYEVIIWFMYNNNNKI